MAEFTIRSRRYGKVTFTCPDERRGALRLAVAGGKSPVTLPSGRPVQATPDTLEVLARTYWRRFLAAQRAKGLHS